MFELKWIQISNKKTLYYRTILLKAHLGQGPQWSEWIIVPTEHI